MHARAEQQRDYVALFQTAMADRTAVIAEDQPIAFRIGINVGEVVVDGLDIYVCSDGPVKS